MPPQQRTDFPFSRHNRQSSLSDSSYTDPLLSSSSNDDNDQFSIDETSLSFSLGWGEKNGVSRNINIVLLYTWFAYAGRSIWKQNVLSTFAFLLSNGDPKKVGFLTAAMGLTQLIVSFPAGVLADKYRRDRILKVSSLFGVIAIVTTLVSLQNSSYYSLMVALCTWGCFWGMASSSVMALFADSVRDGERTQYFTTRSILVQMGNLTGPVVALIMFALLGDKWTIKDCSIVMAVGQLVAAPGVLLLCFLNDDAAIQDDDLHTPLLADEEGDEENNDNNAPSGNTVQTSSSTVGSDSSFDQDRLGEFIKFLPQDRIIPIVVATADMCSGIAAGMSIPYLAIFLVNNLHISPVKVQIVYILAPLLQATLMKFAQMLANQYGRCRVATCFKWIGISLMYCMVGSYAAGLPVWFTCALMVVRTGFMNSTQALTGSVVMDHVPKEERAKWSSLESLNMFSWSGSAILGGLLFDYKGIIFNFCVTAGLQLVATMPYLMLAWFEKQEPQTEEDNDDDSVNNDEANNEENNDNENNDELEFEEHNDGEVV